MNPNPQIIDKKLFVFDMFINFLEKATFEHSGNEID